MDELRAVIRPRGGALAIEKNVVAAAKDAVTALFHIETHRRQVVDLADRKVLRQHCPAVSVDAYVLGLAQSCALQLIVGEAIDARLADAYLDPRAATEHGSGGIGMLDGSYAAKTEE